MNDLTLHISKYLSVSLFLAAFFLVASPCVIIYESCPGPIYTNDSSIPQLITYTGKCELEGRQQRLKYRNYMYTVASLQYW